MPQTPWLIGQTTEGRSTKIDSGRSINFYPEVDPNPQAKSQISLIGTWGSVLAVDTKISAPVRGAYSFAEFLFLVCGDSFLKWDGTTLTTLGTLNTSTGRVSFVDNGLKANDVGGDQLAIFDGAYGYIYNITVPSFSVISRTARGYISAVEITDPGDGYTAFPLVAASGGSGGGFGAPVTLGITSTSTIYDQGRGYLPGDLVSLTPVSDTAVCPVVKVETVKVRETRSGASVTHYATGSGYHVNDVLTLTGGTYTTQAQVTVTSVTTPGGKITGASVLTPGSYTSIPANLVPATGGTGSNAKLYVDWGVDSISISVPGTLDTLPAGALSQTTLSKAVNAAVAAGGSGYVEGEILSGTGGTFSTPFQFVVATIGGTGNVKTVTLVDSGEYTDYGLPPWDVTSDRDGTDAVLDVFWDSGAGLQVMSSLGVSGVTITIPGSDYPSVGTTVATSGGSPSTPATLTPTVTVNDGGLPSAPTMATFLDGYIAVTSGMSFAASDLYDAGSYNPLALASALSTPDNITAITSYKQQLYLIKNFEFEVWYNSGNPTSLGSPFAKIPGIPIGFGTQAPWSLAQGGDCIFFLGYQKTSNDTESEFVGVVQLYGYAPQIISPPNITYRISRWNKTNAFGYCYSEDGHTFYVITDPDADETLVYDLTTKMWHERSSYRESDSPGVYGRHFGNAYVFYKNKHYLGDYQTGKLYEMSSDYYDEDGNPIISTRISDHFRDPELENVFISRLYVDAETGAADTSFITTPPQAELSWSNDGGYTWSNSYQASASMGRTGEYSNRLIWRRLGYAKQRVFKLVMSDAAKKTIIGSYAEIS